MAKKDLGEMKRAAGFQLDFWTRLTDAMLELGITAEQLFSLDEAGLIAATRVVAEVVCERRKFVLEVDYGWSVASMLSVGRYDGIDSRVGHLFQVPEEGRIQTLVAEYVHFGHEVTTKQAEEEIARRGLRPATKVELAAFGAQHPDEQRRFPIVALGSFCMVSGGVSMCAGLFAHEGKRLFNLMVIQSLWGSDYRFLAVPKEASGSTG